MLGSPQGRMALRALTLGAVAALLVSGLGPPGAAPSAGALTTPGPPRAIAAAAGDAHTLVVGGDGRAYGAGFNWAGQLTGTRDTDALTLLTGLPDGVRAIAVAAGDGHTLVLGDDGQVYGSGHNDRGQLTGTRSPKRTLTPLRGLPTGISAVDVAAGDHHSLVLSEDGRVFGAGENWYGQLTGRRSKRTLTPLKGLPVGVRATAVAAGSYDSLVVADDGLVYGAGDNYYGQLTGPGGKRRTLTPLTGLPAGVQAVEATGDLHSLVVGDDGQVYGTGANWAGQLTGTRPKRTLTPLTGLPVGVLATAASAYHAHSLVVGDDGRTYGTGGNWVGQLTGTGDRDTLTPLKGLPAGVRAVAAAAGWRYSLVVADDGRVYGTGRNQYGQLTGSVDKRTKLTELVWGITNTVRPRIAGTPRQGRTLTARHGTWWPVPTVYAYRWYRDGAAITGATGTTHRVVARDVGARLTVKVTAKHPGYQPTSSTSVRTPVITR